jgi:hypothetical protein
VDYYLDKEKKEIETDKELFTNKIDNYRNLTLERETSIIKEFFDKSDSVRHDKMDKLIESWENGKQQTYNNTWGIVQHQLFIHKPEESGDVNDHKSIEN